MLRLYLRPQSPTSSRIHQVGSLEANIHELPPSIPGRDGIPLKYICSDKDEADVDVANDDFLDNYVASARLEGNSYVIDTLQVHTFLLNIVSSNDTAEAKIQGLSRPNDGREHGQSKASSSPGRSGEPPNASTSERSYQWTWFQGTWRCWPWRKRRMTWWTWESWKHATDQNG